MLVSLSLMLISFHFVLGVAAGTAEQDARMRAEKANELSDSLRSIALNVGGPLLAGGASILVVNRVGKNPTNRSRSWLVGFVVALGTFGILLLV